MTRPDISRLLAAERAVSPPVGTGVFHIEREGLLVLANCSATQNPALVRDFAARHPDSPMLVQLRRRCGGEAGGGQAAPGAGDFSNPTNASGGFGEPNTE